jgi:hypothetical protein
MVEDSVLGKIPKKAAIITVMLMMISNITIIPDNLAVPSRHFVK